MEDVISSHNQTELKECIHDILNGLSVILANLEMVLLQDEVSQCHVFARSAQSRLNSVVDYCQLLKKGKAPKVKVDISTFLNNNFELFRSSYPQIQISVKSNVYLNLEFNGELMINSIFNILKNSIEAGANKMVIEVNERGILFVDNGNGISAEDEKIIKSIKTTKESGSGLGLVSISNFCHDNNWELKYKNNNQTDYFPKGLSIFFLVK